MEEEFEPPRVRGPLNMCTACLLISGLILTLGVLIPSRSVELTDEQMTAFLRASKPGIESILESPKEPKFLLPGGKGATPAPAKRPSVITYTPSTAPAVPPPTLRTTNAPTKPGDGANSNARKRPWKDKEVCPEYRNLTDPFLLNQRDKSNNLLPSCKDPGLMHGGPNGAYHERGYVHVEKECLARIDTSTFDLACKGTVPDYLAGSYDPETGKICRCGGFPMQNDLCMIPKRVTFEYDEVTYAKANGQKPTCIVNTKWEEGRIKEGRYFPPDGCTLLDMNPRSVIKHFPNKLFFIDGDSHQFDKFWGFVGEMRNQRTVFKFDMQDQWGKDARYEVTEKEDVLDVDFYGGMNFGDPSIRKCRISSPCTIFIYRFDRTSDEYVRTAKSFHANPPDYYIAAWMSRTYAKSNNDPQLEVKAEWFDIIKKSPHPVSVAWTSFPMNSGAIIDDVTQWLQKNLTLPNVSHRFAITEHVFWSALEKRSPGEPGRLTLNIIWHDLCSMGGGSQKNNAKIDHIIASEFCLAPIPKTMYRVFLSLFAMPS